MGGSRRSFGDQYQDVLTMFATLEQLPPRSSARRHQRDSIITRCLPLADHVAGHFSRRGESLDDLVQVARIGLVQAVDRFDTSKGADFVAFAVPTMMGEVRRYFRDHGWTMHVPRGLRDLHVRISRATSELLQNLGRTPTASELAEQLGVDRNAVVDCLIAGDAYQLRSLDAPVSDSDSDGEGRCVADTIGDLDRQLEAVTDHETVCSLLATLSDRERRIVEMRFFDSMTQTQIATEIGVSQMQVSRILTRTMAKLRTAV
ncbi:MAG: SigB/SigF/SigG family RNA polymerase sigma factor [Mycobacterium sp.]